MPNMQERLETAVSAAENDVSKFHNIINGNDTVVVTTEGGNVPSVAKQIKDTDMAIKSGVAGSILQAESARDAAVAAKNAALAAQTATVSLLMQIEAANPMAKTITVYLDNARYNRSKMVMKFLAQSRIKVKYLPTYSPNLNLIERLWLLLKKNVLYNKYFPTFAEIKAAIRAFFESLRERKSELESLLSANFQLLGS